MTQPIDRETAIALAKEAGFWTTTNFVEDHVTYLVRFYELSVAHSRKDAEPVAWQGRVWYMEPDNCWSSWRDIPDSDLPFQRERITSGSKRELRALFTHPPEADKLLRQALEAQKDMLSGWRYIRHSCGDLYGVGWDRAEGKVSTSLESIRTYLEGKK